MACGEDSRDTQYPIKNDGSLKLAPLKELLYKSVLYIGPFGSREAIRKEQ